MANVNGLPNPRKNITAFVENGTISKNVTFAKDTGVTENGRKVVKAGTVVTGFLSTYNAKGTVSADGTNAEGILLHDVDTTDGDASGAVMIQGWINTNKVTIANLAAVKTALPKVGFIANGAY